MNNNNKSDNDCTGTIPGINCTNKEITGKYLSVPIQERIIEYMLPLMGPLLSGPRSLLREECPQSGPVSWRSVVWRGFWEAALYSVQKDILQTQNNISFHASFLNKNRFRLCQVWNMNPVSQETITEFIQLKRWMGAMNYLSVNCLSETTGQRMIIEEAYD